MKKLMMIGLLTACALGLGAPAEAINVAIPGDFCQLPPFLNTAVTRKPNILILQDNSGSMAYAAYRQAFQSNMSYYGYFEPTACYEYTGTYFKQSTAADASFKCANATGTEWAGTFLNWLTMRRIDIARKVLVGGKGDPRAGSQVKLKGEDDVYFGFNKNANASGYSPLSGDVSYSISSSSNRFTLSLEGQQVDAGGDHTCARNETTLFCWGRNANGQLGNGTTGDETTPTSVSDAFPKAVTVSTGLDHSCAITQNGSLKCWGNNSDGQLGTGDLVNRTAPTPVILMGMITPIRQVTAGNGFTCAIDALKRVYCWGRNDLAQLGLGHVASPQPLPTLNPFISNAVDVSAGDQHACVIVNGPSAGKTTAGCWGANDQLQVGCVLASCPTPQKTPVAVINMLDVGVTDIDAGVSHTCAVVDGLAFCWGDNKSGQLGSRSAPNDSATPRRVVTSSGGNISSIASVSAGGYRSGGVAYGHACLVRNDGDVYCWGANATYQIGDNSTTDRTGAVSLISNDGVTVAAGGRHTCVLLDNGGVSCWGADNYGQVGNDNSRTTRKTPTAILANTVNKQDTYYIEVQTEKDAAQIVGVLHELMDQARLGLMFFDGSNNGADVKQYINDSANVGDFETALENVPPNTSTPLAEALLTGVSYYRQANPPFVGAYVKGVDDPWLDPCANSFVLLITDGEPTEDDSIPAALSDYDKNGRDYNRAANNQFGLASTAGTFDDYLDDLALWSNYPRNVVAGYDTPLQDGVTVRTRGHRHDKGIPVYMVYTFGDPKFINFHKRVGINGAFVDQNGNNLPDLVSEWDQDADGQADGFFNAEEGDQIESAIRRAFASIMQRTAAGTSISMVSTNRRGDGSIVQSYFRPIYSNEDASTVNWLGMLQALWIDNWGNVREDTEQDQALDPKKDRIILYTYNSAEKETYAQLFEDADADGARDSDTPIEANKRLFDIHPIWEAGAELAMAGAASRHVYAFYDIDGDQMAGPDEIQPFDLKSSFGGVDLNTLLYHPDHNGDGFGLPATWSEAADNLIQFIRGEDVAGKGGGWDDLFRSRHVTDYNYNGTKVNGEWMLGDVMFSTPIIVGEPAERYDLLYHDKSYAEFFRQYAHRKPIMYVGANDGMMHVFNPGRFDAAKNKFTVDSVGGAPDKLGAEIAALIPQKAFSMLQYLAFKGYNEQCHISFMDQPPRVTDARIFADDDVHPKGWGTILIAQMRLGCHDQKYSSMLVLDITNPDYSFSITDAGKNVIMAELQPADMGFAFSMPAIAKVGQIDTDDPMADKESWFLIAGTGPDSLQSVARSGGAALFVWDLRALAQGKSATPIRIPNGVDVEAKSFTSGIVAVDHDLDYSVDMLYFGTVKDMFGSSPKRWGGGVYRVALLDDPDPKNWKFTQLVDGSAEGRPFPEAPNVYLDPEAIRFGKKEPWISVGSGRFLSRLDPYDDFIYPCITGNASVLPNGSCPTAPHQAVYNFREGCKKGSEADCATVINSGNISSLLADVTQVWVKQDHTLGGALGTLPGGATTFESYDTKMAAGAPKIGWILQLGKTVANPENKERMSGQTVFHAGARAVFFSSYAPGKLTTGANCQAEVGGGNVYAVHYRTGLANPNNPLLKPSTDKYAVGNVRDPNCATCVERMVTDIPGIPATPTIHKNKLIIQDNNANLITLDRGMGPTPDRGFILWRAL